VNVVWKAAPNEVNPDWLVQDGFQDTIPTRSTGCISVSLPHYCKEHGPTAVLLLLSCPSRFGDSRSLASSPHGKGANSQLLDLALTHSAAVSRLSNCRRMMNEIRPPTTPEASLRHLMRWCGAADLQIATSLVHRSAREGSIEFYRNFKALIPIGGFNMVEYLGKSKVG